MPGEETDTGWDGLKEHSPTDVPFSIPTRWGPVNKENLEKLEEFQVNYNWVLHDSRRVVIASVEKRENPTSDRGKITHGEPTPWDVSFDILVMHHNLPNVIADCIGCYI